MAVEKLNGTVEPLSYASGQPFAIIHVWHEWYVGSRLSNAHFLRVHQAWPSDDIDPLKRTVCKCPENEKKKSYGNMNRLRKPLQKNQTGPTKRLL